MTPTPTDTPPDECRAAYLQPVEQRIGYMRDWSCITLPSDDAIWVGKGGISKNGREFINGLFDRIIQLEEENRKLKETV